MATKQKATINWQHFDRNNVLYEETQTTQTVYALKNGKFYVSFLGGRRYVTPRGNEFVGFGSKRMSAMSCFNGSQFEDMLRRGLIPGKDRIPDDLLTDEQRKEREEDEGKK